jgi:TolB-like protein
LIFAFENCLLDTKRRELRREGALVAVEPGVFDLLQYLVRNRERVVDKDDLIAAVWKGYIVSASAISVRINAARSAIGDTGEAQRLIRTFPRKGFRFVAPVREAPAETGRSPQDASDAKRESSKVTAALALPEKPSIAVLPFANMSRDLQQDYFADGITEDLITELSRLRWFFVSARDSSFAYKSQAADLKTVGQELGVRYVLEGSVRRTGRRVRITGQLVEASTGRYIWAERYDRRLTDIFAVQDEITASVAAAIEPQLLAAEGMRAEARPVNDLDAWDLVARAWWHFWKMSTAQSQVAIELLRQAVARHPNYAPAHSMLAWALAFSTYMGWTPAGSNHELAKALAQRALDLDDKDPRAYQTLGFLAAIDRQTDEAVRHLKVALNLNPNFAAAHRTLAWALVLGGRPEECLRHCEEALRMNPRDESQYILPMIAGAHYQAGRYADAAKRAKEALERRPGSIAAQRLLCASLGQAGRIEEARSAMCTLRQMHPGISVTWIRKWVPYAAEPMEHFLDGLRKAGLGPPEE